MPRMLDGVSLMKAKELGEGVCVCVAWGGCVYVCVCGGGA